MRLTLACAALLACALVSATAFAQTGTGSSGTGTCSGMITGTIGLSVNQGGSLQSIQAAALGYVFGNAECECAWPVGDTNNIQVNIKLTQALPVGSTGTVELWAGPSCDTYQNRTTGTPPPCQKVATLDINDFTTSSTVSAAGIFVPLPGDILMSPNINEKVTDATVKPTAPVCTSPALSNQIYLFIYSDASNPSSTCTLPLTEQNQGPTAVSDVVPGAGDGAVTLKWSLPPNGSYNPNNIQILCSDDCGGMVHKSPSTPGYSTCINGVLHRRAESIGGALSGGSADGGTTTSDLGTLSAEIPAVEPDAIPAGVSCTTDGGVNSKFTTDMGTAGAGPMADLDPMYACSSLLSSTATSARITGLTNNSRYHFIVLSVDNFGNATPSATVEATPVPTEDLYRRYRDAGGAPGGCFIATAAFGSYESGWVYILRDFRDQVLLPSAIGHDFVDWYYANSPPGAAWIAERGWARAVVRVTLLPLIAGAFFWVYFAAWQKVLFLLLLVALAQRKRIAAAVTTIGRGQRA